MTSANDVSIFSNVDSDPVDDDKGEGDEREDDLGSGECVDGDEESVRLGDVDERLEVILFNCSKSGCWLRSGVKLSC